MEPIRQTNIRAESGILLLAFSQELLDRASRGRIGFLMIMSDQFKQTEPPIAILGIDAKLVQRHRRANGAETGGKRRVEGSDPIGESASFVFRNARRADR